MSFGKKTYSLIKMRLPEEAVFLFVNMKVWDINLYQFREYLG